MQPAIFDIAQVLNDPAARFPFLLKPAEGSSSIGVTRIHNHQELAFFSEYIDKPVLQELLTGKEYTLDVLVDFEGRVRCVVPRLRLATRAGEISKGITVKDRRIMEAGARVASALPGAVGCITIQCFVDEDEDIKFIEINPRFGGGAPLSTEAGADYPHWLMEMHLGHEISSDPDGWKDGLLMMRYDEAIFAFGPKAPETG